MLTATIPGIAQVLRLGKRLSIRYCRGVYATYASARAAIPPGAQIGFDARSASAMFVDELETIRPSDYPVLFWISRIHHSIRSVFDFGGNVGRMYYASRPYLEFPNGCPWLICDLPGVTDVGRRIAERRGERDLHFTNDFQDAAGFDVVLASGSLQYMEADVAALLASVRNPPEHLLVNRLPLSPLATYYTVQDIGPALCPYRIANEREFVVSIERVGYRLVDLWRCPERACRVLFRWRYCVPAYSGMYFHKETQPDAHKLTGATRWRVQ